MTGQTIKGQINDHNGLPLHDASIEIRTLEDSLLIYSLSNREGMYLIELQDTGTYRLRCSFVGHIMHDAIIVVMSSKEIMLYDIQLESALTDLGVEVKARKIAILIKDDSITFNVGAFRQIQDKSLNEVLDRIPGVRIENGKIYINNEIVDEVLINGMKISPAITSVTKGVDPIIVKEIRFKRVKDEILGGSKNVLDLILANDISNELFGMFNFGSALIGGDVAPDIFASYFYIKKKIRIHLIESYDQTGSEKLSKNDIKLLDEEEYEKKYTIKSNYNINSFGGRGADFNNFITQKKIIGGLTATYNPFKNMEITLSIFHDFIQSNNNTRHNQILNGNLWEIGNEEYLSRKNSTYKGKVNVEYVINDSTRITFAMLYKTLSIEGSSVNNLSFENPDSVLFKYNNKEHFRYLLPAVGFYRRWKRFGIEISSKGEYLGRGIVDRWLNVPDNLNYPLLLSSTSDGNDIRQSQQIGAYQQNSSITFIVKKNSLTYNIGINELRNIATYSQNTFDNGGNLIFNEFFKNITTKLSYLVYSPFLSTTYFKNNLTFNLSVNRNMYHIKNNSFVGNDFWGGSSELQYQYGAFRVVTFKYEIRPETPSVFDLITDHRMMQWNNFFHGSDKLKVVPASVFSVAVVHSLPKSGIMLTGLFIEGKNNNNYSHDFSISPIVSISQAMQLGSSYRIFQVDPSVQIGSSFSSKLKYAFQKNNIENLNNVNGKFNLSLDKHEASWKFSSLFNKQIFNFNLEISYNSEHYTTSGTNSISNPFEFIKYHVNLRSVVANKKLTFGVGWKKFITLRTPANSLNNLYGEFNWYNKKQNIVLSGGIYNALNVSENNFISYHEWGYDRVSNRVLPRVIKIGLLLKFY